MRGLGMYICIYNVYNAHVFWNHALSMNKLDLLKLEVIFVIYNRVAEALSCQERLC